MNGARKLARDFIAPHLKQGPLVLDVCCGDCWLRDEVVRAGGTWHGVDRHAPGRPPPGFTTENLALPPGPVLGAGDGQPKLQISRVFYDLIVSCWGLQHLMESEGLGWARVQGSIAPSGRFIYIGRYSMSGGQELGRSDPLNGYNYEMLRGLALASGFNVVEFQAFSYEGDKYTKLAGAVRVQIPARITGANAFGAVMEPI